MNYLNISAFATRCGHLYHQICITKHVIEHSNCPYCKKDCTLKQLVKLRWRQVDDDDEFKFKAAHTITSSQLMESFTELNNAIKKSDLQVEQLQ